jgi:hypothetical protein
MKSWKTALGLGAACAACCAIPLLGAAGGLAALATALAACADELLPAVGLLLGLAVAVAGLWWYRRQARRNAPCACTDTCAAQPGCR